MILAGVLLPLAVYLVITALHLLIPVAPTEGYVHDDDGNLLTYRLNGLRVFLVTIALWLAACSLGLLPWDLWWTVRWESLLGAFVLGWLFTFWIVLPAASTGRSFAADLFLGRRDNPQWLGGRIDAKMWLYLVGATQLGLNLYGFAAHHWVAHGSDPNLGIALHVGLFSFFLCEYLWFERVHLYTYDFVAEKVGFKLGWGCLVFYPYFYAVGLWSTADLPNPDRPVWWLVGAAVLFFGGWSLARGANLQKYWFKRDPSRSFLGIQPEVVTDGEKRLLVNGFWGVSRHVNYLGELGMATGLALSLGHPLVFWTWLYPLYYVLLLVPRQIDDDRRCAAKYGPLWTEYRERVRWRIVPGLY
jgi:delta14-sterol reductase